MKYNVLGAGPAGISASIVLAKKGFDVNIYEQTSVIGGFIGSDIQAIRNYGTQDENILERFKKKGIEIKKYNNIFKIEKYAPDLRYDSITSKDAPLFYTIKRGVHQDSLENQLIEQALDNGANLYLGEKLEYSRAHVIANGSKFYPEGAIYGAVFENSEYPSDLIKFFFMHYNGHSSYFYIAPYNDGTVTLALTSFDNSNFKTLKQEFESIVKDHKIISPLFKNSKMLHRYGGHGHFNIPKSGIHGHKFIVGGAAGFVDPARGFGIKYAVLSGALAGEAITTNKNYDDLWKKEFEDELVEGFSRKLMLERVSDKDINNLISGKTIPVTEYEKTPNSIKKLLHKINGNLHLEKWRGKFKFKEIYPL